MKRTTPPRLHGPVMPRSSLLTGSLLGAFAASLVALQPACVSVDDDERRPTLTTQVDDWRDEVIYQVLVDRFANGDLNNDQRVVPGALARYQGGDWTGLTDKLGYLSTLGITTLWISPVVRNVETDADVDAYHGYWAQDLTATNPHFGDMASLRKLVQAAHDRGMKVVLDIVTNHMGQAFFYDINLNGKADINVGGTGFCMPGQCAPGQSASSRVEHINEFDPDFDVRGVQAFTSLGLAGRAPMIFIDDPTINRVPPKPGILGTAAAYHGMGRITSYDEPRQVELGDFPGGLKDVATEDPTVRATMVDAYARWVEETDLDGFRIDTVKHVEHEFWQVFSQAVRQRLAARGKKKFLMFGEAFDGNDALIGSYTKKGELDSVFYFSQHFQVFHDVFALAKQGGQAGTKKIEDLWAQRAANYGTEPQENGIGVAPTQALVNFMDNHDRPRFLWDAKGDVASLRNALSFLMTEDGIPCMYYGTELEFAGGNDPSNREVYWSANPSWRTDGDTFRHFAKLARLRKDEVALRRGENHVIFSTANTGSEADAGMFVMERSGGDAGQEIALAVFNVHATKTSTATFTVGTLGRGKTFVDAMGVLPTPLAVPGTGQVTVSLPAQSAAVFVVQR